MNSMHTFRPKSPVFISFVIILNLLIVGVISFSIISLLSNKLIYFFVGLCGCVFLILDDVLTLRFRIIISDEYIVAYSNYFQTQLNRTRKTIKINLTDIESCEIITLPVQLLQIKVINLDIPIFIYLKQYSKSQVLAIKSLLDEKINSAHNVTSLKKDID